MRTQGTAPDDADRDPGPVFSALRAGDLALAGELLALGAGPWDEDGCSETSLHLAAERGDLAAVAWLLASGWGCYLNHFTSLSQTPLMCAARRGHGAVAEALLAAGADVHAQDHDRIGETALHAAVEGAQPEVVSLLLRHGANPAARGWMWLTPMDRAGDLPAERREAIVALLREPALAFRGPRPSNRKRRRQRLA